MHFWEKRSFSVLECLVLVALIGVFTLGALPKFSHLTLEAQTVSNQQLADTLQKALSATHATWVSSGSSSVIGGSYVLVDGQRIHVNSLGWPDNGVGVSPAPSDCAFLWNSLLNNAPIAGCEKCAESCHRQSTNGCYITTTKGATCVFTLCSNPVVRVLHNISNGIVSRNAE
jgi:type II secretory pathway pseudopilin PulG